MHHDELGSGQWRKVCENLEESAHNDAAAQAGPASIQSALRPARSARVPTEGKWLSVKAKMYDGEWYANVQAFQATGCQEKPKLGKTLMCGQVHTSWLQTRMERMDRSALKWLR